jgi:hypothetical protein
LKEEKRCPPPQAGGGLAKRIDTQESAWQLASQISKIGLFCGRDFRLRALNLSLTSFCEDWGQEALALWLTRKPIETVSSAFKNQSFEGLIW